MLRKLLLVLYVLASTSLMIMGYIFEEPYGNRKFILLVLCVLYMALIGFKIFYKRGNLITIVLSGITVILLLGIELYSKYAVNYFFHTLYLLLIFFVIIHIRAKYAIALCGAMTALSFVKFIQLIAIAPTFANMALMVFFGSFQILIVVIGVFLKVYQDESQKTKSLYEELLHTHDQLKIYAREIKDLSQMEARTVIARDLHDTLGHDMTGLIMQMEMASGFYKDGGDMDSGNDLLEASKKSARDSLIKVREIVETLKNNESSSIIKNSIKELIDSFSDKTGCTIHFSEKGIKQLKPEINLVLYRVIQESMTNALRHGEATLIYVSLIYKEDKVIFVIEDNGIGCESVVIGNGLSGMKDRLKEVGGTFEFKGRPNFIVKGQIPMKG